MTGSASLAPTIRLMTWLSPAFPLGAFAYSHGLEALFEAGDLSDRASFEDWLVDMISEGTGGSDAGLCAQAWAAAPEDAAALEDLADGQPPSEVTPFWRLIDGKHKIAKKLSVDPAWIDAQRKLELADG